MGVVMPLDLLIAFLAATAVFAYMPGPGMLYTSAQTLARGRRAGLLAAAGLHLGGYLHVFAAAAGLAALLAAVPTLYLALKLAGALYLIWLGLRLVFARAPAPSDPPGPGAPEGTRAFVDSALVEALNPKTAVFFLAFLPQFTMADAAWPVWLQLLALGTVVNLMFSSADLLCVAAAAGLRRTLARSARVQRWLRAVGGTLLVGLGVKLAAQRAGPAA
jgi:threonine/homoserine/homoserine lactone efflux protein